MKARRTCVVQDGGMPDAPAIATPVGFEDARAPFPVLERFAYLNAGTFGPLARRTVDVLHVREIPGSGLLRASCGWWTSEGDLDRLVAALDS